MIRFVSLLFFVFFLASCGPQSDSTSISSTDVLNLRLGGEPTYLNPVLSTDSPSSSVEGLIFNGLFRVNSNLELEPDLVSHYTVDDSGTRYLFYLKEQVKWHDGTLFSAEDVVFTFETILDRRTNTVRRSNFVIDGVPIKFTALSPTKVEAVLSKPFAPFLSNLTIGILPKHILKSEDINTSSFNRNPVGTGPFVFREWSTGQYVVLERNASYFGEPAQIERIVMTIIPDANTALVSLEKGEIDQAGIPAKDYKRYAKQRNINLYQYYDLVYTYLGFNLKHPFFSDNKVRRAIAHAIKKEAIVEGVLKGFGLPAHIPSSPVLWSYPEEVAIPKFDYDPLFSKELLEEAGFIVNPKTQMLEKNGEPFSFTIITNKGNKDREKVAQIIQRYLYEIGIDVSIQLMEWSALVKIINDSSGPRQFDAIILGWSLGLDPDGYAIWHSSQYPVGFNFIGYENLEVDQLLEAGRATVFKRDRMRIYEQVYQHIAHDLPYVFLYFPETIVGINKRVAGLSEPGPAGLMNPIEAVYITE